MSAHKNSLFACFLLVCFAGFKPKCPDQNNLKLEAVTLNDGLSQCGHQALRYRNLRWRRQ